VPATPFRSPSHEQLTRNLAAPRIADVFAAMGIDCITPLALVRAEKWKSQEGALAG